MSYKTRRIVLNLYRKILRTGHQWQDIGESQYILQEASKLFREQINEQDKDKITALIDLGEERLEVAKWSNIPYARPVHMGGGGGEGLSGHKEAAIKSTGRRRVNSSGKTIWKTG